MENSEKLVIAFIILLAISISAYPITQKHLLNIDSYSELLLARNAVEGKLSSTRPLFYQLTAFLYRIFSPADGKFDEALLINIAKVLPVIFAVVCALSFYLILRCMLPQTAAMGGAALLVSSQAFLLKMGSGIYSRDSLGMCAFVLACSCFFLFYRKKNYLLLLASVLLFGISAFSWNAGWVMGGAILLSLIAQLACEWRGKQDVMLAHGVIALLITFVLLYFLTPQENIFNDMKTANLQIHLISLPLIAAGVVAFAAHLAGKHKCKVKFEVFIVSMLVISVIISLFDLFPSSFGVALFSAFALNELLGVRDEKLALILLAGTLLFVSFEFSQNFLELNQAVVVSFLIAATSVFIASMYRERRISTYIAFSVAALLLFSSISTAALTVSQRIDRTGAGFDEMAVWVGENLPENATIWSFRISPVIEFTTGRGAYVNDTEFARFMLSNQSATSLGGKGITHILVDASLFDSIEVLKTFANNSKVRIDSFRLAGYRVDAENNVYAAFISGDGRTWAFAPVDPMSGSLLDGNVIISTIEGSRAVPFKKFLRLGEYRLVYPQDNYRVNLFTMFFEEVSGLKPVYISENGEIKIYEVAG